MGLSEGEDLVILAELV